jgi:hypothetical protein
MNVAMLLDRSTAGIFEQRLRTVTAESRRRWGALEPPGMLTHLRLVFEGSLGRFKMEDKSNFVSRTVIRFLVLYVLPWPKGKIRVPESFTPKPEGGVDEERGRMLAVMREFVEAAACEPARRARHPIFGNVTLRTWSRIHALHLDHHLRQFGS